MTDAKHLLAATRELAPKIAARAPDTEANRTLPGDLVQNLRDIGVFRMFTPKSHGGLEVTLGEGLEVIATIARADGSAGWTAMIGSAAPVLLSRLPRQTFDRILHDNPNTIQAGLIAPAGTAEIVTGGYRVSGRWGFSSGCKHADWILGGVRVLKDGVPVDGPIKGQPLTRAIALPAQAWQIEDTWHAAGLKGTGSHHTALKDAFVPEDQCFDPMTGKSCIAGPLYDSVLPSIALFHAAFAVGLAEGAFADLLALANAGKQAVNAPTSLRNAALFQYELGRVDAEIRAARALYDSQVAKNWRRTYADQRAEAAAFIESQQTAIWATAAGTHAVDQCYILGGGSALYESSPLQRRMRDMRAATQHVMVHQRHYMTAGQLRLGLDAIPLSA